MGLSACVALVLERLGFPPFRPRAPWITGDLQTLRDTLRPLRSPPDSGLPIPIDVGRGDRLLALWDQPPAAEFLAVVVLLHGLGGSSGGVGLRRLGRVLQQAGFAVLRLNLRGAGQGRPLAHGTYAASCNADLAPVLQQARQLAQGKPLLGMGFSLGGTILLNGQLDPAFPRLDGLVCISSPLDLQACSRQIERPRNRVYEGWLLKRLLDQTLEPGLDRWVRTIRDFDAAITAPRWGYGSVQEYYAKASPLPLLLSAGAADSPGGPRLPPSLIVHALDDPWVPVAGAQRLARAEVPGLEVLLTPRGGHNGFHAVGDHSGGIEGSWGDRLTARWFRCLVGAA